MPLRSARTAFAIVAVVSITGAVIRVATAPDRIRERRITAQSVCASSGGTWMTIDKQEICSKPDVALPLLDTTPARAPN
jgi:hypothetical protein